MAQPMDPRQALRSLPADYASVVTETVTEERTPEQLAEDEATRFQAMSEGVEVIQDGKTLARRVTFMGKQFRIADKVGLMPLMEFAYHANSGLSTDDMGALVAIYEMLKDCIADDPPLDEQGEKAGPSEWDHFVKHAKASKADAEDLMPVVQQTIELLTARPTSPESDSSKPSQQTSDSLTDTSSAITGLVPVADLGKVSSG